MHTSVKRIRERTRALYRFDRAHAYDALMNAYPYPPQMPQIDPAVTRSKDAGDLNLLSILHYVWTGLLGCTTFGMVGYFVLIAAFIGNAPPGPHASPHAVHDQEVAATITVVVGVVMALFMIPLVVLHLLAAAGLKKRTRYMLAFVMSCFTCLSFPLGTALGVWSILVLQRPSVKALFGR